jgi:hypothetical protein
MSPPRPHAQLSVDFATAWDRVSLIFQPGF